MALTNFSVMMECTSESGDCHSVGLYSGGTRNRDRSSDLTGNTGLGVAARVVGRRVRVVGIPDPK